MTYKRVTQSMLDDLKWIEETLSSMDGDYSKLITKEMIGRSVEFIKGVFYERERINKELSESFWPDLTEKEQK